MRQNPRHGRLLRLVGAVLALDLVLAVIAATLFIRLPDRDPNAQADVPGPTASVVAVASPTTAPSSTAARTSSASSALPESGFPASAPPQVIPSQAPSSAPIAQPGALAPNPLVSLGKPAFASAAATSASALTDGRYCGGSVWRTDTLPSWAAIRVGAGPQRLLLSWNGADPDDYLAEGDTAGSGVPVAYTIETSADSTNGADGTWREVARVRDNAARTRGHSFPFAGASWVRLTISDAGADEVAIDEIDLHDISLGSDDSVFFLGDSITAAAFLRCDRLQPSYAALVREAFPTYAPALIDGGVSGVSSDYGTERIDQFLADNPDYALWAIAYGTNDAYRERPSEVFAEQLQTIIDRVRAAGKEPVLATIPYTNNPDKDIHVQRLNGVIAQLTARNGLRPGPDLYTWFRDHPGELAADGIHPTPAGSLSINRLWFEALKGRYGTAAARP
jgi:lysophospholipase L1-like esterase